jgi:hypothetical protein
LFGIHFVLGRDIRVVIIWMTMQESEKPADSRWAQLVLIGFLSMVFAEAFSGSSILWFITRWAWFVTLPLYWSHALLFLNLAIRSKRTSVGQLYLWGILFGLYESWVTKVLWAGYLTEPPLLGTVFGFAIAESIVLLLFWHPIIAFVLPILVFQILAQAGNTSNEGMETAFPTHTSFLQRSRRNSVFYLYAFIIGSLFMTVNSEYDFIAAGITALGSLILVLIPYYLIKRRGGGSFSIQSLRLGKKGLTVTAAYVILTVTAAYVILLYAITFPILRPEGIPGIETIIATFFIYVFVILLIYASPPVEESEFTPSADSKLLGMKELKRWYGLLFLLLLIWAIIPEITIIIGTLVYLSYLVIGSLLFMSITIRELIGRAQS